METINPKDRIFNGSAVNLNYSLPIESNMNSLVVNNLYRRFNTATQFDKERLNSGKYRLYGKIEYISPFSTFSSTSPTVNDFFINSMGDTNIARINTQYNFYIVKPSKYIPIGNSQYILRGESIYSLNEFELNKQSFSVNIYFEKIFEYFVNQTLNIENINDLQIKSTDNRFIQPLKDLYLVALPKPAFFQSYTYRDYSLNTNNQWVLNENTNTVINANDLYLGTYSFNESSYTLDNIIEPNVEVSLLGYRFLYNHIVTVNKLRDYSSYNEEVNVIETANIPFYAWLKEDVNHKNELNTIYTDRDSNNTLTYNICNVSYLTNGWVREVHSIQSSSIYEGVFRLLNTDPETARERKLMKSLNTKKIEVFTEKPIYDTNYLFVYLNNNLLELNKDYYLEGFSSSKILLNFVPQLTDSIKIEYVNGTQYIYKDLLEPGYIEDITLNGVDYPFINDIHYIYSDVKFDVKPNFNHQPTKDLFEKFMFDLTNINNLPNNDFNGDGC